MGFGVVRPYMSLQQTALDANLLPFDVNVFVIEDACDGVDEEASQEALRSLAVERVSVVSSVSAVVSAIPTLKPPPPTRPPSSVDSIDPIAHSGTRSRSSSRGSSNTGVNAGASAGAGAGANGRHSRRASQQSRGGARRTSQASQPDVSGAVNGAPIANKSFYGRASDHLAGTLRAVDTFAVAALVDAAWHGNLQVVSGLLKRMAASGDTYSINMKASPSGQTALHVAVMHGHCDVVVALLDAGAGLHGWTGHAGVQRLECHSRHM